MVVSNSYIKSRLVKIMFERQAKQLTKQKKSDKEYRIKLLFPKWLRKIIFHPFNPLYSVYLQNNIYKDKNGILPFESSHPYVLDYLKYYMENDLSFDIDIYFPKDKESVLSFIDYKLVAFFSGKAGLPISQEQKEILKHRRSLQRNVSKTGEIYSLRVADHVYKLPKDAFQGHVFIHEYGLKELSTETLDYIKGKDFLDVGACLGDSSILFLKYQPRMVYAYEPVKESINLLEKTITLNNSDKIKLVKKGIGDVETTVDISVDTEQLSRCSLNDSVIPEGLPKETIEVTTIDKECHDRKVGLIKMDIEGFEYNAIQGALETIRRDKPVLLISIYHTAKDFFEIPPILKQIVPSYQFRFVDIDKMQPLVEKIIVAYPQI